MAVKLGYLQSLDFSVVENFAKVGFVEFQMARADGMQVMFGSLLKVNFERLQQVKFKTNDGQAHGNCAVQDVFRVGCNHHFCGRISRVSALANCCLMYSNFSYLKNILIQAFPDVRIVSIEQLTVRSGLTNNQVCFSLGPNVGLSQGKIVTLDGRLFGELDNTDDLCDNS